MASGERTPATVETPLKAGIGMGLAAGVTAIMCCVSPVVLVLLGIVSAVGTVSLGDSLYCEYGWFFRAAGLVVAAIAVTLHLRRSRSCTLGGARRNWRTLGILVATAVLTYLALFCFTKYLGIWFG